MLPRNKAGRQYQLHIGLPGDYVRDKSKHYPVVYVTDGYWDFEKMQAVRGPLVYDKVVPEFIIVGMGYPGENLDYGQMRWWELSPVAMPSVPPGQSGRAAEFLQTLETEIIPFIEREYRTDPKHRVLAGASLGGLFTLYAMYSKPELFSGYVAATPAVVLGDDWLLRFEDEYYSKKKSLPVRLFVSAGEMESPGYAGGIVRYHKLVESRNYEGLAYKFRVIDGERHAGMQTESYSRGLRFVFEPIAPETGPAR